VTRQVHREGPGVTAAGIARALCGRKSPSGWMARCPAHEDHNPSLSIAAGADRILVCCHAGCEQSAVIDALKARGLWPEPPEERTDRRIVAEYAYTDEAGELLYQVCRFEPKDFRPRFPDGRGNWIWKKHPRQVLYRLPEVLEAPIVFVVEGERDVETLRSHGFVATTNAGGAKAPWLSQYTASLSGREVIIIPDNDAPGWQRAATVANALLGAAARIRVVDELPKSTKDITAWFEAGHSECELFSILHGVHFGA
jgi:putative DNA primase/helicase